MNILEIYRAEYNRLLPLILTGYGTNAQPYLRLRTQLENIQGNPISMQTKYMQEQRELGDRIPRKPGKPGKKMQKNLNRYRRLRDIFEGRGGVFFLERNQGISDAVLAARTGFDITPQEITSSSDNVRDSLYVYSVCTMMPTTRGERAYKLKLLVPIFIRYRQLLGVPDNESSDEDIERILDQRLGFFCFEMWQFFKARADARAEVPPAT